MGAEDMVFKGYCPICGDYCNPQEGKDCIILYCPNCNIVAILDKKTWEVTIHSLDENEDYK